MRKEGEIKCYLDLRGLVWRINPEYLQRKVEEFETQQQNLVPTKEELKVIDEIFKVAKERFETETIPRMIELNQGLNFSSDIQD